MLSREVWGRWGKPCHPGISVIIANALVITAFGLEIDHLKNVVRLAVPDHADAMISAAFA